MFQTVVFLAVGFNDVVFSQFLKTYVKKGNRDLLPLAIFKNISGFCFDDSVLKRLDDSDFKMVQTAMGRLQMNLVFRGADS